MLGAHIREIANRIRNTQMRECKLFLPHLVEKAFHDADDDDENDDCNYDRNGPLR